MPTPLRERVEFMPPTRLDREFGKILVTLKRSSSVSGFILSAAVSTSNSQGAGSDALDVETKHSSRMTRFQLARRQGFGVRVC